jgi:transketolase
VRNAFIKTLCEVAAENERLWLLCGDLGFSVLEGFRERFPLRFVNVGVAEQNMTGLATGLALCGKIVFTYSIANFPTLRCLEQIRNDVCYHEANVKIVAIGGGLVYGPQGYTHHGLEDLAIMRALPNMTVLAPGDAIETELATRALIAHEGPGYLRLGGRCEVNVHKEKPAFEIGKIIRLKDGNDAVIISTGGMLENVWAAATFLERQGCSIAVWSCPCLKPMDTEAVIEAAKAFSLIVTVEEAQLSGGLAGAVAEILATLKSPRARLYNLGLPEVIMERAFSQDIMKANFSMDATGICRTVLSCLG